ncbi:MAG: hypothetical protein KGR46_08970 [Verrucomicrobia bacterium]|nr:hypothetical protein [Verrucomicrobiota bacterium]
MTHPAAAVAILLALAASAPAETNRDIIFAVPAPGRITLAAFDQKGKPVRTIHALDGEEAFRVGLNGYATSWDGLDNHGEKVPPGTYHIRGYLIGDVAVHGEAIHFNDWITGESAPALRRVDDFSILPDGSIALLGTVADGTSVCALHKPDGSFSWTRAAGRAFPEVPPMFASGAERSVVWGSDGCLVVSNKTGGTETQVGTPPVRNATAIAATDSQLLAASENQIHAFALPSLAPAGATPAPAAFSSLATGGNSTVAASPAGIWVKAGKKPFEPATLPATVESLSLGANGTFWFCGAGMDPSATPLVGQATLAGQIERAMVQQPGEPRPKIVRASPVAETFGVLESAPGLQRLRILSRDPQGAWTIDWERTITNSDNFGFSNGTLTPDAGPAPQRDSLQLQLEANPLTNEQTFLKVRAKTDAEGTTLATEDGLPVVRVADRPGIRRVALERGAESDSIRFLQGDGASVEEFRIDGLRHIIPINAGTVQVD